MHGRRRRPKRSATGRCWRRHRRIGPRSKSLWNSSGQKRIATMPRGPHGHARKIDRIMSALKAEGALPDALRPVELLRRIYDKALELGYDPRKGEFPSRTAVARWLSKSNNTRNTDDETNETLR